MTYPTVSGIDTGCHDSHAAGMDVKELIEVLSTLDPTLMVVLQKDSEGNGYSPLSGVYSNYAYREHNSWSGEIGFITITDELRKSGYSDEDLADDDATPCVVLSPTN